MFELSPPTTGQTAWTETVLHTFRDHGVQGQTPNGGLIADSAGDLYGTTFEGGASGEGTVFELVPPAKGRTEWKETVLYSFSGSDGAIPSAGAGLIADGAGNLYGTTELGGSDDSGVAFKLSPPSEGQMAWTETVLHNFENGKVKGGSPEASLLADKAGNLYGTTVQGGKHDDGIVFKITP